MIRNSFIFLAGIGRRKERLLWEHGIMNWHDFLAADKIKGISLRRVHYYRRQLEEAKRALHEGNSSFFVGKLPFVEMWRLYSFFRDEIAYLDLEVDGKGRITVVGVSDDFHSVFFVRGANLEKEVLEKELGKYKLLVTFNGSAFDLPHLKKDLGVRITIPHIDLKSLCPQVGLEGGLKDIEEELNLKRPVHLHGSPVDLWKAFHASGDREWLDLLIEYNREDVENLKIVLPLVYKRKMVTLYRQKAQYPKPNDLYTKIVSKG